MTQIATIATRGLTMLGTGKGAGSPASGAGTDFAAVVAGLAGTGGAPADESVAPEGDDAATAQDFTSDAEGEQAKGEPVVQDLALTAAAQNAMADMVVPPPVVGATAPVSHAAAKAGAGTEAITLDGAAMTARPSWRMALAVPAPVPVTETLSPVSTPATGEVKAEIVTTGDPTVATPAMPRIPRKATEAAKTETAQSAEPSPHSAEAAPAADLLRRIAAETPQAQPVKGVPARAVKSASAVEAKSAAAVTPSVVDEKPTGVLSDAPVPAAPVGVADMLRRRPEAALRAAAPAAAVAVPAAEADATPQTVAQSQDIALPPTVVDATAGTGVQPVPVKDAPVAVAAPVIAPLATPTTQAKQPVAQPAPTEVQAPAAEVAVEAVAVAAATPDAPTVRPVMSSLHRAPATPVAEQQAVLPAARQPSGKEAGTGQQQADTGTQGQPAPTDSRAEPASAPRAYADIVQSLPPIAQNAIGAAADPSATVAPTTDVRASLENNVIDMSVGGQWIDRVAQEITQLAQGTGHSRFQLSPPNLGRIQIDIRQGEAGGASHVQMLTETTEAAQRLRDGQSSLQSDARLAALSLGTITIAHAAQGFDMGGERGTDQNPRQQAGGDPSQAFGQQQGSQSGQGSGSGHQQHQPGQTSQTGLSGNQLGQNGGQQGQQQAQQAGQQGTRDGNNGGQGKSSLRRDVLETGAVAAGQDGGLVCGTGDRLVRYA